MVGAARTVGVAAAVVAADTAGAAGPVGERGQSGHAGGPSVPPPIQTIRSFFPETWIWDLVEVG